MNVSRSRDLPHLVLALAIGALFAGPGLVVAANPDAGAIQRESKMSAQ